MTAQKAQIESLIQELDEILGKTAPRLPWLTPNDAMKQRQVLEQTRRYLVSLQEAGPQSVESLVLHENNSESGSVLGKLAQMTEGAAEGAAEAMPASPIDPTTPPQPAVPAQTIAQSIPQTAPQTAPQAEVVESAQQALQAVVQEMNYLRSNLLQPMRSDMDVLQRQRETLMQEIRQLEAQRQQYALPQQTLQQNPQQNQLLMEFLQAAFRQMQENLAAQVTQMMATLGTPDSGAALPEISPNLSLSSSDLMALSPAQRLEQMQRVQTQSDQLLLKLDSSLRIIFNSLQQNVQTYQDSLEQGLSRMHSLGEQGEAMFAALVTRLAEQLGREASTFLQSSIEPGGWEPFPTEELSAKGLSTRKPPVAGQPRQTMPTQPPGTTPAGTDRSGTNPTESDIARLLEELNELDAVQPASANPSFVADASFGDAPFGAEAQSRNPGNRDALDLLDLELNQLDLDAFAPEPFAIADEDLTVFQDEPLDAFLSADLTVLQDDSEPEILQSISLETGRMPDTESADDPSGVLDLLNQLSIEPDAEPTELQPDLLPPDSMPLDSRMANFSEANFSEATDPFSIAAPAAEPPLVGSPDTLYEDEFYQSLFGDANPQPIAPEDLFADVEVGELGETAAAAELGDLSTADQTAANSADLSLSSTVQESWFSGFGESFGESFGEPFGVSEAASTDDALGETLFQTEEQAIVEVPELSQTVENVLLPPTELPLPIDRSVSSPHPVIPEPIDSDLSTPVESAPLADSVTETIGSLLDLVPFAPSDASVSNSMDLAVEEQAFELAQPGEDLLTDEPSHRETLSNLRLPADALDQLAQDLSSLEGGDETFTIANAGDWMLPDAPPVSVPLTEFFDEPLPSSDSPEPASADFLAEDFFSNDSDAPASSENFFSEPPDPASDSRLSDDLATSDLATFDLATSAPLSEAPSDTRSDAPSEEEPAGWDLFENRAEQPLPEAAIHEEMANEAAIHEAAMPEEMGNEAAVNAFTLEGLDILFENLPAIDSTHPDETAEPLLDVFIGSEFNESGAQPPMQSHAADSLLTEEEIEKKNFLDDSAANRVPAVIPDAESDLEPSVELGRQESTAPSSEDALLEETALQGTLGDFINDLLQLPPTVEPGASEWYLGLDIGTTGISAVLFNRSTCKLHPIYWQSPGSAVTLAGSAEANGQSSPSSAKDAAEKSGEKLGEKSGEKQFRLPLAVSLMPGGQDGSQNSLIRDFKPYLNLTLPYDFPESSDELSISEPVLSWSDDLPILLMTLRQAFQALIAPLAVENPLAPPVCGAVDLRATDLAIALHQLSGVVVSIPADWSEAYRFNVREALLAAELVERPEQIFFLEESIATMLAAFAGSSRSPLIMPQGQALHDIEWQGNTLILCAGATQTELALIELPSQAVEGMASPDSSKPQIAHADFHIRTLAYAGTAIDQDIITQLLYPLLPEADPTRQALGQLLLPGVGEPDAMKREALQRQLRRTKAGRSLIETARILKLNLQQQTQFILQIGDSPTTLLRQDLTTKVLLPYVQRLNRELNTLLNQAQIAALNVRQVVCTGGTASLGAITRWLQQKLPNALILQDAYPWSRSIDYIPTCSRVAYGLAALPMYPAVLDRAKHQYSDFFLLLELIRSFPSWAMTLEEVLEMLQQRGIDAPACRSRILSMLEGQYPPGLIPAESEMSLLTRQSQQNPLYQELRRTPIFYRELYPDGIAYRLNPHHLAELNSYFDLLLSHTHQPLLEPYSIALINAQLLQ